MLQLLVDGVYLGSESPSSELPVWGSWLGGAGFKGAIVRTLCCRVADWGMSDPPLLCGDIQQCVLSGEEYLAQGLSEAGVFAAGVRVGGAIVVGSSLPDEAKPEAQRAEEVGRCCEFRVSRVVLADDGSVSVNEGAILVQVCCRDELGIQLASAYHVGPRVEFECLSVCAGHVTRGGSHGGRGLGCCERDR